MTVNNEETAQTGDSALPFPDFSPLPDDGPLLRPATPPPAENTSRRALLVMAKQPIAGRAKTRLVPPLTSNSAASLYHCFLQDILATVRAAAHIEPFTPVIAYTPAAARDFFRQLAPDFWLIPQQSTARASDRLPTAGPQLETLVHHPERLGDRLQFCPLRCAVAAAFARSSPSTATALPCRRNCYAPPSNALTIPRWTQCLAPAPTAATT